MVMDASIRCSVGGGAKLNESIQPLRSLLLLGKSFKDYYLELIASSDCQNIHPLGPHFHFKECTISWC